MRRTVEFLLNSLIIHRNKFNKLTYFKIFIKREFCEKSSRAFVATEWAQCIEVLLPEYLFMGLDID